MTPLELISARLMALEAEIACLKGYVCELEIKNKRRRALRRRRSVSAFAAFAISAAGVIFAYSSNTETVPRVLSSSVTLPALDSFVTWARRDAADMPGNHTTEILSLVADGMQVNSYLWPLYVELRGTTNGKATATTSQSAGALVRALVRSTGSPWTAGFHSEIAHGREGLESGAIFPTQGTSILMNGEMRSYSSLGQTIGVNLQCVYTDSNSKDCDDAVNIQAGSPQSVWKNGLHFDSKGQYPTGNIGINFDRAHYNTGIDLGDNSLKLNADQKIILDQTGKVYLRFNSSSKKIEIVNEGSIVASF